jgi:hypothetical protein
MHNTLLHHLRTARHALENSHTLGTFGVANPPFAANGRVLCFASRVTFRHIFFVVQSQTLALLVAVRRLEGMDEKVQVIVFNDATQAVYIDARFALYARSTWKRERYATS